MIGAIILGLISAGCFTVAVLQFKEKGFLFNNAFIYASKEEREKMNKTPHYRQSGVVFTFIGAIFAVNALEVALKKYQLFYLVILLVIITIVYAIASSVRIERNK